MIRVLQIFHEMDNGGTAHFIMNYYRHIERKEVQFDFLTSVNEPGYFDQEIRSLGGRVFHAYPFSKNPIENYCDIARIIRINHYQIVHRHTGSAFGYFDLQAARHGGAKHLILHAHNTEAGQPLLHKFCKVLLKTDCHKLACSPEAGRFLFGKKAQFDLINNAIEASRFSFNAEKRVQTRKKLGIGDSFVIGHIGRFEEQKNHKRLLSIFSDISSRKNNCLLVCVGDGSLMSEIKRYAQELGIFDRVLFLGQRNDVDNLLQAFDVFLLPSLYEGLPVTLIEAQANGLKCFASKGKVSLTSNITGNVSYIPLEDNDDQWATKILAADVQRDEIAQEKVRKAGYDIITEAEKLTQYYLKLLEL